MESHLIVYWLYTTVDIGRWLEFCRAHLRSNQRYTWKPFRRGVVRMGYSKSHTWPHWCLPSPTGHALLHMGESQGPSSIISSTITYSKTLGLFLCCRGNSPRLSISTVAIIWFSSVIGSYSNQVFPPLGQLSFFEGAVLHASNFVIWFFLARIHPSRLVQHCYPDDRPIC